MVRLKSEIIYENTVPAIFVQRNNRFTAEVMIGEEQKTVHIKNTGRLEELLATPWINMSTSVHSTFFLRWTRKNIVLVIITK